MGKQYSEDPEEVIEWIKEVYCSVNCPPGEDLFKAILYLCEIRDSKIKKLTENQ